MTSRKLFVLVSLAITTALTGSARAVLQISSDPTQNVSCVANVCTATAKKAVLNTTELTNSLASGDVTVKGGNLAEDVVIDAALSWTGTQRLTLDAYRSISFNKPVVVAGAGALTIITNDGGSGGDFSFIKQGRVEFWDSKSHLSINGHSYQLLAKVSDLVHALKRSDGSGRYFAFQKNLNSKSIYSAPTINKTFNGVLEGLGNKISNLTIHNNQGYAAFLLSIGSSGVVRDLRLIDADISGVGIVGALATSNIGTVLDCVVSGQVLATDTDSIIGGLVGANEGTVSTSGSSAAVTANGTNTIAGGLFGENLFAVQGEFGMIDQSYASGPVSGGDGAVIGGLVGKNYAAGISNSYATGSVTGGNNALAGGLIGASQDNPDLQWAPQVSTSYSTGAVSAGSGAIVGGLIGQDAPDAQNTSTYWNLDTSGIGDPAQGAGNIVNDPGITGLTDAQLKSGLPAGFDKKVWKEKANLNGGYPYLIDLPPG